MHPPPLTLQRVSREDQYMTEGVTHVQRRNELLGADQAKARDGESDLEKYYAPVLDTPSVRIPHGPSLVGGTARVC
jgi:hypothetical protein